MSRRLRVSSPPATRDPALGVWMREVADALNGLPNFSIISTSNGPESSVTGASGDIAIDVGSSATTLWVKLSGITTSGWTSFAFGL